MEPVSSITEKLMTIVAPSPTTDRTSGSCVLLVTGKSENVSTKSD